MFAAYRDPVGSEEGSASTSKEPDVQDKDWLQSKSYTSVPVSKVPTKKIESEPKTYNLISDDDEDQYQLPDTSKSHKKDKDTFFIDNKRRHQYLELETLPNRCVAKYKKKFKSFHKRFLIKTESKKFKRYFKQTAILKEIIKKDATDDFKEKLEKYQSHLAVNTKDVEKWIEYFRYQETTTRVNDNFEKIGVEILEKALFYNPTNVKLIKMYLKLIPSVYRSEKVFEIIDDYVEKNSKDVEILECLIESRQNSMVFCNVAEVLKIYEKVSKNLYSLNDDLVMMRILKKMLLFIRQCGLNEQFFVIVHLILNLNISAATEIDKIFYAKESQNKNLMEYEEMVLKSDLPMNELFWRIEKLRSICNFLPIDTNSMSEQEMSNDPQRIVFKDDVYNLLYPLRNPVWKFDLFIMILKLMKYPFERKQSFQNENLNSTSKEIECGMEFLGILLRPNFCVKQKFNQVLFGIMRDANISPNYLSFNIEYENYLNLLVTCIISCSKQFSDKQNLIILLLWIRLERLLVILDKMKDGNSDNVIQNKKAVKQRIKKILKQSKFQNNLNIFAEFALIECEFEDFGAAETIFEMAFGAEDESIVDYYNIAITYCEFLVYKKTSAKEKVIEILEKLPFYPLNPSKFQAGNEESVIRAYSNEISEIETAHIEMDTEDYFKHKNVLFYATKALILYIFLKKSKKEALEELENRINHLTPRNTFERFIKENYFELYIQILDLKTPLEEVTVANNKKHLKILENAIKQCSRNISILHTISSNYNFVLPWYLLKKLLLTQPTIESIFYLIVAAKYRAEIEEENDGKSVCKQRIFNTLNFVMKTKTDVNLLEIQESVLMCRLFLRSTFDYDFSRSKSVLYTNLERTPYSKSIILDGIIFCPDELTNLLDVVFEKGLRIHTLPEELNVLREGVRLAAETEEAS